jgi:hypothetical protein
VALSSPTKGLLIGERAPAALRTLLAEKVDLKWIG